MNIGPGIKALSIKQPWAWLIAAGYKDIENRDWRGKPSYRGPLLIHASKSFDKSAVGTIKSILWDVGETGLAHEFSADPSDYDRGGFVGLCRLNDVVEFDDSPWFFGPLGFKLRMPKEVEFLPWRGQLGLWDVPDEAIRKIKVGDQ